MKNYIVGKDTILINYLIEELKYSHKEAKKKLANNQILVNNKKITQYNYNLKCNDSITINNFNSKINDNIEIIYEDKNIIVVNKPSNLLTVSTNKEKEKTLYHLVSEYLKKNNKNSKVFVIHRLDRETSGIVMFAKSTKIQSIYQNNWDSLVKYRGYQAIVEGIPKKSSDTIIQYLKETDNLYVFATKNNTGKKAITCYKVTKSNQNYSLLDIEIKTGRKNQIRVAMQSIGNSIVGDKKYGNKNFKTNYFCLHANKLVILDPNSKKILTFEINIPTYFNNFVH